MLAKCIQWNCLQVCSAIFLLLPNPTNEITHSFYCYPVQLLYWQHLYKLCFPCTQLLFLSVSTFRFTRLPQSTSKKDCILARILLSCPLPWPFTVDRRAQKVNLSAVSSKCMYCLKVKNQTTNTGSHVQQSIQANTTCYLRVRVQHMYFWTRTTVSLLKSNTTRCTNLCIIYSQPDDWQNLQLLLLFFSLSLTYTLSFILFYNKIIVFGTPTLLVDCNSLAKGLFILNIDHILDASINTFMLHFTTTIPNLQKAVCGKHSLGSILIKHIAGSNIYLHN